MNLENLRREMDELNVKIIELLAKRVHLAMQIAAFKKKKALPIEDTSREKLQAEQIKALAAKYNLSPEEINEIFLHVVSMCKNKMRSL